MTKLRGVDRRKGEEEEELVSEGEREEMVSVGWVGMRVT